MTDLPKRDEDRACCACLTVVYGTTPTGNGTSVFGRWRCKACGRDFTPVVQQAAQPSSGATRPDAGGHEALRKLKGIIEGWRQHGTGPQFYAGYAQAIEHVVAMIDGGMKLLAESPKVEAVADDDVVLCQPCLEEGRKVPRVATTGDDIEVCQECLDACDKRTDWLDLMIDEFRRIRSCPGVTAEIQGLCDRAVANTRQNVPVIVQRDRAVEERDQLRRELEAARADAKALTEVRSIRAWAMDRENGHVATDYGRGMKDLARKCIDLCNSIIAVAALRTQEPPQEPRVADGQEPKARTAREEPGTSRRSRPNELRESGSDVAKSNDRQLSAGHEGLQSEPPAAKDDAVLRGWLERHEKSGNADDWDDACIAELCRRALKGGDHG